MQPSTATLRLLWDRPQTIARRRLAVHALLFLLTLFTTTVVGVGIADNFNRNKPVDLDLMLSAVWHLPADPILLFTGMPFALTLMTILLAHEFGHYIACRYHGVDASLPYFLPAPTLIGTLGAFIRIRSPIYTKRALFDVGVAGPIAGFVFLVPALFAGLEFSRVSPGIAAHGDFVFGTPLLLRLFEALILPGVRSSDIYLHPVARAAWAGMLATALNLLPIGQLDGGHIVYAFFSQRHKLISRLSILALIITGRLTNTWLWYIWAALLFFLAMRHPVICDIAPLGARRARLGLLAVVIFVLCFTPNPVSN